ncbi:MAG: ABC transporter permease [Desulfobacterales bacterium]|nr:ABC transporter permease [Desulfobacterales bacterium]
MVAPLKVGLAGLGTVGVAVVRLIDGQREALAARCGRPIEVVAVTARTKGKDRGIDLGRFRWVDDPVALAADPDIDVFVELMGGEGDPAKRAVETALTAGKSVVTANKAMLAKVNFPREALILSAMGQVSFDFGVRLLILAVVFVVFKVPLTWGILLSLPAVIMIMLLGTVLGILITPMGILYSDVSAALPILTSLWLFLTPVVYPPPQQGLLALLFRVNPVSPLLVAARDLATRGTFMEVGPFIVVSVLTLLGVLVMWVIYRVSFPILLERISARKQGAKCGVSDGFYQGSFKAIEFCHTFSKKELTSIFREKRCPLPS